VSLELRSARSLDRGERAELFTSAYEGYFFPFSIDEHALAFMEEVFDLDVDASRVALRDDVLVGLGNLGVRGEDAWIGGVGVVPAARRSGVGRALMQALHDRARERGVQRVWLEVIDRNLGAFALYEKLGYRVVRDVEVWSLPAEDAADAAAREVPVAVAHARIRELRSEREPWQRADETLAHYGDARGLESDGGAAVFRPGGTVQLVQLAGNAAPLLRALRERRTVSVLNLPTDDPAAVTLEELGGTVAVRQHEMLLEL
jgi:ribosomal protein S18 acetylase RimI-like enzyme